jgi:outer membrane lipoprotein-sorting protein
MRISVAAAAALLGMTLAAPAAAQTVDDVVAKHLAARGGEAKLKAVQTIKFTRTIGTPFTKVNVTIYRKRPNLLRVEQAAPGQPPVSRGINADAAWDTGPGGKTTLRPAPLAAEGRDLDADFDGDLLVDWKAKGHTVVLDGKEAIGGADAYKLTVTTKSGATRTIHLDAATYLDRQHSGVNNLPGGRKSQFTMTFSNWHDVEGIKFPFDIDEERQDGPITQSFATYTHKVELNAPMEDTLFATPAGAAAPPSK